MGLDLGDGCGVGLFRPFLPMLCDCRGLPLAFKQRFGVGWSSNWSILQACSRESRIIAVRHWHSPTRCRNSSMPPGTHDRRYTGSFSHPSGGTSIPSSSHSISQPSPSPVLRGSAAHISVKFFTSAKFTSLVNCKFVTKDSASCVVASSLPSPYGLTADTCIARLRISLHAQFMPPACHIGARKSSSVAPVLIMN